MRVRFCGLELDDQRRELSHDGEPLAVEPRVFDLLTYLVRHRDRLVRKEELLERLWPGCEVQEGALAVCVHRARRLLEADGHTAIRTVARCGYRFVAAVELLAGQRAGPRADGFAGRDRELSALVALFANLQQNRLHTFEVRGPAGIGKTALLEELGTWGRRRRLEVLRSAPAEDGQAPFSLWAQVIAAYVARYDARSVRRAIGEHVDVLARHVPALRPWASQQWSELGPPSPELLAEAVIRSVHAATAERPVLLLFDDVDRADADSIAVLRRVLSSCPGAAALIGVAFREVPPMLVDVVDGMRRRPRHLRLELSGLDRQAVRQLLAQRGHAADARVVADALRATAGNPRRLEQWNPRPARDPDADLALAGRALAVRVP